MPRYFYKCLHKDCEEVFEVVHSMKEKFYTCSQCSDTCEKNGIVERIPINMVNLVKKDLNRQTKSKTGSLVNKSIKEFKQNLKDERQRLKEVEYK